MRTPMDEATFLEFYKNTLLCGSNNFQRFICKKLELDNKITFEEQRKLSDSDETLFFESKRILRELLQRQRHQERFQVSMKKWSIKSYINIQFHFFMKQGKEQ
ncbi:MAG: hypothetical protein ACLTQN_13965 [Blautia massiliensis (ex Durand et al. 2017)]